MLSCQVVALVPIEWARKEGSSLDHQVFRRAYGGIARIIDVPIHVPIHVDTLFCKAYNPIETKAIPN